MIFLVLNSYQSKSHFFPGKKNKSWNHFDQTNIHMKTIPKFKLIMEKIDILDVKLIFQMRWRCYKWERISNVTALENCCCCRCVLLWHWRYLKLWPWPGLWDFYNPAHETGNWWRFGMFLRMGSGLKIEFKAEIYFVSLKEFEVVCHTELFKWCKTLNHFKSLTCSW